MDVLFCTLLAILMLILIYLLNRRYRRDFITEFNSKYVLITGCDTGFGHHLALSLDERGLHVYAGCYTTQGAEKLAKQTSERLKTIPLDITDQKSVEKAKQFIENDLPAGKHLWGLVNNAGTLGNICFALSTIEDYQHLMDVNFFGQIRMAQVFAPLIKKCRGRIVQVISILGRGCCIAAPYTASKFALEAYTDEFRRYMRKFRVRVMTIEPGTNFATNILHLEEKLWEKIFTQRFNELPESAQEELGHDFVSKELDFYDALYGLNFIESDIQGVVDAMINALGAQNPKTRYVVGIDARPLVFAMTWAPDWLFDAVLRLVEWYTLRQVALKKQKKI